MAPTRQGCAMQHFASCPTVSTSQIPHCLWPMCLFSCPPFSHAVAILMFFSPNDWVESSQYSPPVSNDDTAQAQSAPMIFGVWIRRFVAHVRSIHAVHVKISCHRPDQQSPDGGPTTDRTSLRNSTSRMWRPRCRILRCPARHKRSGWRWPQTISISSWWKRAYPKISIYLNGKHARQLANEM